jgi:hypothetical protein
MMLNSHAAHDAEYETTAHYELMQLLAQILRSEHNGNGDNGVNRFGSPYNGRGAVDRRPSRGRTAQDAGLPSPRDTGSFLERFPDAARIKFAGHGRY